MTKAGAGDESPSVKIPYGVLSEVLSIAFDCRECGESTIDARSYTVGLGPEQDISDMLCLKCSARWLRAAKKRWLAGHTLYVQLSETCPVCGGLST